MKPLCIDLFCGLGGWADGFLAEGYDVIGFDIERHRYPRRQVEIGAESSKSMHGKDKHGNTLMNRALETVYGFHKAPLTGEWDEYPGQLVLQDVLTLNGSQFRDAAVIVASPPCQEFSYMAMPWTRAKEKAAYIRARQVEWARLTALFWACFRIAREARVPLVVENVCGAQPWVGRAAWHYGSFYLWGDVPALMPPTLQRVMKQGIAHRSDGATNFHGFKLPEGHDSFRKTGQPCGHLTNPAEPSTKGMRCGRSADGERQFGGPNDPRLFSSKSSARKAASAQIAKIPFPLAQWIARCFKPEAARMTA